MSKLPYMVGVALIATAVVLPNAAAQASTDTAPGLNKIHRPAVQRAFDKVHAAKEKIKDTKCSLQRKAKAQMQNKALRRAVLGKVTAVNGNSFTVETNARGTLTINTDSTTVFKNGNSSDIAIGKTILAHGEWDQANKKLTARMLLVMPIK